MEAEVEMVQIESRGLDGKAGSLAQSAGGGWHQARRRTRWVVSTNTLSLGLPTLYHLCLSSLSASRGGDRPGSILSPKLPELEPLKDKQPESGVYLPVLCVFGPEGFAKEEEGLALYLR